MLHLLQILMLFLMETYKVCPSLDGYFSLPSALPPQELLKQLFIQVNACVSLKNSHTSFTLKFLGYLFQQHLRITSFTFSELHLQLLFLFSLGIQAFFFA